MYFGDDKNKMVFSLFSSDTFATDKAEKLKDKFYEELENYMDKLYEVVSSNNYSGLFESTSGIYLYVSGDNKDSIHITVTQDYDPYRGAPEPLEIRLFCTDTAVQRKLRSVRKTKINNAYNKLVEEVLHIKKVNNLKVVDKW